MKSWKIPRLIHWILLLSLVLAVVMTVFRVAFYLAFPPRSQEIHILSAFLLGLRYDARTIGAIMLTVLLLGSWRALNPFETKGGRFFFLFWLTLLVSVLVLLYAFDFGYYAYLQQRLNAAILNFLGDFSISMRMMWQSYPVIKIIIGLVILVILIFLAIRYSYRVVARRQPVREKKYRVVSGIVVFLLLALMVWGRLGQFELRWSDAFSLGSDYKARLSLNPVQSFTSTLKFRHVRLDIQQVRAAYPMMAQYLGIKDTNSTTLNFIRRVPAAPSKIGEQPNVVLVICESFSAYKSSMWGNPLNTTPFFNSIANDGVFFDHCFTSHIATARGVWATITGIPDVQLVSTVSRNPEAVDQHSIMNDFTGYDKKYFLGGSFSWANIRGLLDNNIAGIKLLEQEDFSSPRLDVWGISDHDLFTEANKALSQETKPFFAVIQTADNHRPYSIPSKDIAAGFTKLSLPADSLHKYGFESNEELNAFRYTDFCYQHFFELARKEKYYANTLFVFLGDHGILGNAGTMFPPAWSNYGLTRWHIPLLFYAPGRLAPQRISDLCMQVDVLPTIAGICGTAYTNTTLGRDLLSPAVRDSNAIHLGFELNHDDAQISLIQNNLFYRQSLEDPGQNALVSITNFPAVDNARKKPMAILAQDFFQTASYMLTHNKKSAISTP